MEGTGVVIQEMDPGAVNTAMTKVILMVMMVTLMVMARIIAE